MLFDEGVCKRRGKGNVPEVRNSPNMTILSISFSSSISSLCIPKSREGERAAEPWAAKGSARLRSSVWLTLASGCCLSWMKQKGCSPIKEGTLSSCFVKSLQFSLNFLTRYFSAAHEQK